MEKELRAYVNGKFLIYPKTTQIVDLREELYSMMRDKYNDCLASGLTAKESYRQAITIMKDYKSAIREVETGSSLGALKKMLGVTLAFSSFYFIALTCVYLYVSMIALNSFEKTWLIGVGGAFAYLVYLFVSMFCYTRMFRMKILSRISLGLVFLSLIPLVYVFPSLFINQLYGTNAWAHSWLAIPAIIFMYFVTDLLVFGRHMSAMLYGIEAAVTGLSLTTVIYLLLSSIYSIWSIAWILYVVYLTIVALAFYISELTKKRVG